MHIRPLRPLIPSSNHAAQSITCPPYDVLSLQQAQQFATNPNSFVHVVRPDAAHPHLSPNCPELYTASKAALNNLQHNGLLVRDAHHNLYIYEQATSVRCQRGLVALVRAEDYDNGSIKRHEKTRPDKEQDRTNLTDTLSANTGPVFLTYEDVPSVTQTVEQVVKGQPIFEITSEEGVFHRIWRVSKAIEERILQDFWEKVHVLYIADGHHRAASAARVARMRTEQSKSKGDHAHFLAVLFPAGELEILAYNRVVSDLNNLSVEEFLTLLRDVGKVERMESIPHGMPDAPGTVYIYVGKAWYQLELPREEGELAETLDCAVLQKRVLAPILSIEDPRQSKRIEFIGGVAGVKGVMDKVGPGVGFLLHPVQVSDLMGVANAGGIMPPKSTWFEPKLRSGFFVHTF